MDAEDWLWNQLLDYIEEGLVIPVVGRELLWSNIADELRYVPAHLAREFASRAGIEPVDCDDPVGASVPWTGHMQVAYDGRTWSSLRRRRSRSFSRIISATTVRRAYSSFSPVIRRQVTRTFYFRTSQGSCMWTVLTLSCEQVGCRVLSSEGLHAHDPSPPKNHTSVFNSHSQRPNSQAAPETIAWELWSCGVGSSL
jgi:hypothetical protein